MLFCNVPSAVYQQENRAPQGSVLNVNLFAIVISGMVNAVGLSVSASLFVSDSAVYYSSGSITIDHQLQIAVHHISHWALQNSHSPSSHQRLSMYLPTVAGFSSSPGSGPQEEHSAISFSHRVSKLS